MGSIHVSLLLRRGATITSLCFAPHCNLSQSPTGFIQPWLLSSFRLLDTSSRNSWLACVKFQRSRGPLTQLHPTFSVQADLEFDRICLIAESRRKHLYHFPAAALGYRQNQSETFAIVRSQVERLHYIE
ncbi:hypothetical protein BST61_g7025 [Cercospora zeina]